MRIFKTNPVKPPLLLQVQEFEVNPYESPEACDLTNENILRDSDDVEALTVDIAYAVGSVGSIVLISGIIGYLVAPLLE